MVYKVELLLAAWEDLKRIEDWYLLQFGVEVVLNASDHILQVTEYLKKSSDSGSLMPDEWLNQQISRQVI